MTSDVPQPAPARGALAGLKVLELAGMVAGPFCAKMLADNGAEVIKVEPPAGDESRRRGPFPGDIPHPERSALFLYLNTSKMGVTLDLSTPTGRDIFLKLVQQADILVEDNIPCLMQDCGLDYDHLRQAHPGLIMTSITPFGQTGPYRDYKCHYLNTFHGSGFGYLTPSDPFQPELAQRPPIMMGGFLAEYYSGINAVIATLAALYARRVLGYGQHVDVSKQEAQFISQKTDIVNYAIDGKILTRTSTLGLTASSWGGLMPCRDGWVNMTGTQPHQVAALFDLMGNPEWSKSDKFKPEVFHLHGMEMRPHVMAWAAQHGKDEIFHGGQQRRVPLAAVYTVAEAARAEQLRAREFFVRAEHPRAGLLEYPGAPYRFSRTPARLARGAPLLGEHNQEIYCEHLGYSRAELAALKRTGVV